MHRIGWQSVVLSASLLTAALTFVVLYAAVHDNTYAYIELNIGNSEHQASAYNIGVVSTVLTLVPGGIYHGIFGLWPNHHFLRFQVYAMVVAVSDFGFIWTVASNTGVWDCWALVFMSLASLMATLLVNKPGKNDWINWFVGGIGITSVFTVLIFNMWKVKSSLPMAGEVLFTVFIVWFLVRYMVSAIASYHTNRNNFEPIEDGEEEVSSEKSRLSRADRQDPRRNILTVDGWVKLVFVIVAYFVAFYKRDDLPT